MLEYFSIFYGTIPYSEIVKTAKEYIDAIGGFEKLGEWGLL